MQDIRYTEWFKVRSHEVGINKKITIISLLKLMQEASMTNAKDLKISVWELEKENLAWVLLRKQLNLNNLPSLGQRVKVVTYPSSFDRFLAYRDYKMYDEEGSLLAYASSTWTLMNMTTRKMARMPEALMTLKVSEEENILEYPQAKLPLLKEEGISEEIKIRPYDIDWNGHVNNIQYVRYMIENIPSDYLAQNILKSLAFHIKSECFLEDKIRNEYSIHANTILHKLTSLSTNKVVAIAKSKWD